MLYERSLQIGQRLDKALRLIGTGAYSTPKMAEELGVSIPTVSRYVAALRGRGFDILAKKDGNSWRYVLNRNGNKERKSKDVSLAAEVTG